LSPIKKSIKVKIEVGRCLKNMNIKRFQIFTLAAALSIPMLLTSCSAGRTGQAPNQSGTGTGQNMGYSGENLIGPGTGMTGRDYMGNNTSLNMTTGTGSTTTNGDGIKAQRIKSELQKMNEIGEVNVLVSGKTALVGYKTKGTAGTNMNTSTLKNMIIGTVKKTDPTITSVAASENVDIVSKIKRLSDDIMNNRAAGDIPGQIKQLFNSMVPGMK
jgi:YhcN/YlaJ family sporulation lipoprotein